jgi:hypothetical protein
VACSDRNVRMNEAKVDKGRCKTLKPPSSDLGIEPPQLVQAMAMFQSAPGCCLAGIDGYHSNQTGFPVNPKDKNGQPMSPGWD